jgi:hypothetical protein
VSSSHTVVQKATGGPLSYGEVQDLGATHKTIAFQNEETVMRLRKEGSIAPWPGMVIGFGHKEKKPEDAKLRLKFRMKW